MDLRADGRYLVGTAYATDRLLRDRQSLYEYQQPRIDLVAETLQRLRVSAGQYVADLGCGNSTYTSGLEAEGAVVVAVDISAGMLRSVRGTSCKVAAAAQCLPLAPASVDAAIAMHMLYHVPDPAAAVREAARILRPAGRFVAAIGGPGHLAEADEVWADVLRRAGLDSRRPDLALVNSRLSVDQLGVLIEDCFEDLQVITLDSTVVLTDPEPLLRHAASTTAARVTAARGSDTLSRFGAVVKGIIARQGSFEVTTQVAMFVAAAPVPRRGSAAG